MTKPVNMRLREDLVEAAKLAAETDGITLTAFAAKAIEEKLLRREFEEHARMVNAAEAADPGRLVRKSRAVRDGLATWKAERRAGGPV
ncbi:hypothetical protein [Nocardia sp. NPDC052316]|uniref:hypothetical protein n=1 Tax=Nocardia sp. NPDC052316 TaxID=3364329 RepID=UPI0037CBB499